MSSRWILLLWMVFLFLLLVGSLVWAIFYVDGIQPKISILGVVALIVAAVTSVLTVNINNAKARERDYEFHILKEKQRVFEHFYNSYFEMFKSAKKGNAGLNPKGVQEMLEFKKGLMNWGSDRLIRKYLEYDDKIFNKPDEFNMLKDGNVFLKELRKELGFNDSEDINIISIVLSSDARKELKERGLI